MYMYNVIHMYIFYMYNVHVKCACKCYLNELPSFPLIDTLSLLAIEEERDALERSPLAFLGALTPGTIFLEKR